MPERAPTAGRPVFIYGSLMWSSVLKVLLGRVPQAKPALLRGYVRRRIKNERFPGLFPASGLAADEATVVRGLVLDDLTEREAAIFDEFEDDEYDKEEVQPTLVDGVAKPSDAMAWGQTPPVPSDAQLEGKSVTALAYIWTAKDMLDDTLWLPERDFIPYEAEYLEMCKTFLEEEVPEELRRLTYELNGQVEMKLSQKKGTGFYTKAARLFLMGSADKEAVQRLRISALGNAVGMAVAVAARLEADGVGAIARVRTDYPEMGGKAGNCCARIELDVVRAQGSRQ